MLICRQYLPRERKFRELMTGASQQLHMDYATAFLADMIILILIGNPHFPLIHVVQLFYLVRNGHAEFSNLVEDVMEDVSKVDGLWMPIKSQSGYLCVSQCIPAYDAFG